MIENLTLQPRATDSSAGCRSCGIPFGPGAAQCRRAKGTDVCLECAQFASSVDRQQLVRDQADGYSVGGAR